jgi:CubicO group peptidase (beta-lactamase class C family)
MSRTFKAGSIMALKAWAGVVVLAAGAHAHPGIARADQAVEALAADGFAGVAVVAVEGEIVYARGVGEADPQTGQPIDLDTQFDIASITKSVTGMLAAELIASGELAAEATLADFFDGAPPEMAPITVHQLLTHSAGLRGDVGDDDEALDFDTLRARAFASSLRHAPGEGYYYSNLGYGLLAGILEQVTGQTYEALVIDAFSRAGAHSTGYMGAIDDAHMIRFADGKSLIDTSWGGHAPGWNLIGNGGLASTARDLVAWRAAYSDDELMSQDAYVLAHTPHQQEGRAPSYYGYGLVVEDLPQLGRIYWHNGGSRRFSTHWRDFSDQGVVIVALANQHTVSADAMVEALTEAWFGGA